jgi:hypothetical protein
MQVCIRLKHGIFCDRSLGFWDRVSLHVLITDLARRLGSKGGESWLRGFTKTQTQLVEEHQAILSIARVGNGSKSRGEKARKDKQIEPIWTERVFITSSSDCLALPTRPGYILVEPAIYYFSVFSRQMGYMFGWANRRKDIGARIIVRRSIHGEVCFFTSPSMMYNISRILR